MSTRKNCGKRNRGTRGRRQKGGMFENFLSMLKFGGPNNTKPAAPASGPATASVPASGPATASVPASVPASAPASGPATASVPAQGSQTGGKRRKTRGSKSN